MLMLIFFATMLSLFIDTSPLLRLFSPPDAAFHTPFFIFMMLMIVIVDATLRCYAMRFRFTDTLLLLLMPCCCCCHAAAADFDADFRRAFIAAIFFFAIILSIALLITLSFSLITMPLLLPPACFHFFLSFHYYASPCRQPPCCLILLPCWFSPLLFRACRYAAFRLFFAADAAFSSLFHFRHYAMPCHAMLIYFVAA